MTMNGLINVTGMTLEGFAAKYSIPVSDLATWKSKNNAPEYVARMLLQCIKRDYKDNPEVQQYIENAIGGGNKAASSATESPKISIKYLRRISGLSQECFAEKYCVTLHQLQTWEENNNAPEYVAAMLDRLVKEDYAHTRIVRVARELEARQKMNAASSDVFAKLQSVTPENAINVNVSTKPAAMAAAKANTPVNSAIFNACVDEGICSRNPLLNILQKCFRKVMYLASGFDHVSVYTAKMLSAK